MKYLVMIYSNPASRAAWEGFSDADKAAGLKVYAALIEDLAGTGELVVTEALADPSHGRRPVPGPVLTGDGPYAEAKEHLAGYYEVDCASIERAVELAGLMPEARYQGVEVRPVLGPGGDEM